MPLELDGRYTDAYNVYIMAGEDITKKEHIEKTYNNEDFMEWICLNQYHAHTTKQE